MSSCSSACERHIPQSGGVPCFAWSSKPSGPPIDPNGPLGKPFGFVADPTSVIARPFSLQIPPNKYSVGCWDIARGARETRPVKAVALLCLRLGRSQTKIWKFGQIASDLGGMGARLGFETFVDDHRVSGYSFSANRQFPGHAAGGRLHRTKCGGSVMPEIDHGRQPAAVRDSRAARILARSLPPRPNEARPTETARSIARPELSPDMSSAGARRRRRTPRG